MDTNEYIREVDNFSEENVTPKDLFIFAKWILGSCFIIFVLSMLDSYCHIHSEIFESCKTIVPPIATAVIGFYFGKNQ